MSTATIRITRSSRIANRFVNFAVHVDSSQVGKIPNGRTEQFTVSDGRHVLDVRMGNYRSPSVSFHALAGSVLNFRCASHDSWWRGLVLERTDI